MNGYHEKTVLEQDFPFRLFFNDGYVITPHHWHEDIEIIYLIEGDVKAGVNNELYNLKKDDILIIPPGGVHYFLKEMDYSERAVIQFRMAIYDTFLTGNKDRVAIKPMFNKCRFLSEGDEFYELMRNEIKSIIKEYEQKDNGYKIFLKARLYDLAGILMRYMPKDCEDINYDKQKERLGKLDNVMRYVEKNYSDKIVLDEIANVAGFSKFHFARFFKENTGMTFIDYLNNFRISMAEWTLINEDCSITEVSFKTGFNSIKTFNRVFKQLKGCTPMEYRKIVDKI
ncbi:helix-turn-helix transcriptional regulator [Clostridium gasigenes]|uniref:AraC family transcriptional regulator n=1 Tax=Clostridium gasigenes TaxID=94869 RepID=UPI0014384D59|nr:AraC family transcriptional regulator [Clostridium gasigenes]NKF08574.1 AraC family transcriptional regulator [Clostridium gasigenes]QSW19581.1 helix-turn-helix transcriptional regulator [Clostridium gasigenes]